MSEKLSSEKNYQTFILNSKVNGIPEEIINLAIKFLSENISFESLKVVENLIILNTFNISELKSKILTLESRNYYPNTSNDLSIIDNYDDNDYYLVYDLIISTFIVNLSKCLISKIFIFIQKPKNKDPKFINISYINDIDNTTIINLY